MALNHWYIQRCDIKHLHISVSVDWADVRKLTPGPNSVK